MQPQLDHQNTPLPMIRSVIGGLLMGLANLVPGISGGTMILAVGLYDRFISSIADVTRLRFRKKQLLFLALIACAAVVAIAALAGTMREAVTLYRSHMYALFIGLTLGGVPLLIKMIKRFDGLVMVGLLVGLGAMIAIAMTKQETPDKTSIKANVASGEFKVTPNYDRDVVAGVLGMSAMVMPGISGAYMLLILDRYESTLASIDLAKHYVTSMGQSGDPAVFLEVLIPVAIGSVIGLVFLSNLLKWMLRHQEKFMLGILLGLLLGSVVGIWPFETGARVADYLLGTAIAALGFGGTFFLSRVSK